jgi:hypothetical protein
MEYKPEVSVLSNYEHGQAIERIIYRLEQATGGTTQRDIRKQYLPLLSKMTDRELERVRYRVATYSDRQLVVTDQKVRYLLFNGGDAPNLHKSVCFLFDTTIWALWFSEGDMPDALTTVILTDFSRNFFSLGGLLGELFTESDDWLDYSLGYMIETMVEYRNDNHVPSAMGHFRWVGENVEALSPYREVITSRRDASREFLDIVLNNASPSLSDGLL